MSTPEEHLPAEQPTPSPLEKAGEVAYTEQEMRLQEQLIERYGSAKGKDFGNADEPGGDMFEAVRLLQEHGNDLHLLLIAARQDPTLHDELVAFCENTDPTQPIPESLREALGDRRIH